MTQYILKDKNFFDTACKTFSNFESIFQESCRIQMYDSFDFILVTCTFPDTVFTFDLKIPKGYIEVKEDLKPYVWYDRSEFDGNPNEYALVEKIEEDDGCRLFTSTSKIDIRSLISATTKFMYIERPE